MESDIATTLFIIGLSLYRETIKLPRATRISVATVRRALEEQQAKPLPSPLLHGYFLVVEQNVAELQVARFNTSMLKDVVTRLLHYMGSFPGHPSATAT